MSPFEINRSKEIMIARTVNHARETWEQRTVAPLAARCERTKTDRQPRAVREETAKIKERFRMTRLRELLRAVRLLLRHRRKSKERTKLARQKHRRLDNGSAFDLTRSKGLNTLVALVQRMSVQSKREPGE